MAKQLVKGMTMLVLIVTLAIVTAVSTSGQAKLSGADIPFDFVAADRTLPAGQYEIVNTGTGREMVRMASPQKSSSVFSLTTALIGNAPAEHSKLVFRRYGNRYFLSEIWVAGETEGRKLLKSREERSLEREQASIASKRHRSYERVEIATRKQ